MRKIEQIILDNLTGEQRDFILRMKPHRETQRINEADWNAIEPCVDLDRDDFWPDTYWFGGMLLTWPRGRALRTFCFSEVGLKVRQRLAAAEGDAP